MSPRPAGSTPRRATGASPRRWIRGTRSLLGTAFAVFRDDPIGFWLLVAQQLPPGLVRVVATGVVAVARPSTALSAWRSLALQVLGREEEAAAWVCRPGVPPLRAAAFLVAVKDFAGAEEVLRRGGVDPTGVTVTTVRLRWNRGDVVRAVADLDRLRSGGGRAGDRMRGELALLEPGWVAPRPTTITPPPRPDTVLHLLTNSLPFTQSGYTSRTHSILRTQGDLGLSVHAVTRLGYPSTIGIVSARDLDVIDGVPYGRLGAVALPTRADERLAEEVRALSRVVADLRPAVLHTTTHYVNSLVVRAVAEHHGIPHVYEVRGFLEETWLSKQPPSAVDSDRYRLWRDRETEAMHAADAVVTLGEAMRAEIVARGIDPAKVHLSPNAIGRQFLSEPPDPYRRRDELGIARDAFVVGTVTSVVDYEGLETAVDAVAILREQGRDVVLLVVGDGAARPRIEVLARERGIRSIFTGRVPAEEVHELHACLDVFVVPRRDERVCRLVTPMKPLEAMATGVPVVASDLPALAEIVHDGVTGRLVTADDPADLARVLGDLLDSPEDRRRMGAAGRDFVLRERTWSANGAMYRELYRSLTRDRTGGI